MLYKPMDDGGLERNIAVNTTVTPCSLQEPTIGRIERTDEVAKKMTGYARAREPEVSIHGLQNHSSLFAPSPPLRSIHHTPS